MTLGDTIRETRKMRGLTQIQVANKAKISVNSLRLYEACKREPNMSTLANIANALCVPISSLVPADENSLTWADSIEEKLRHIGYSVDGEPDGSAIWIDGPSFRLYVEFDDLEEINRVADNFLRLKIDELRAEKYKDRSVWKDAMIRKLKNGAYAEQGTCPSKSPDKEKDRP